MPEKRYYIAQANIALGIGGRDDPRMTEFFEQIDFVNSLAEQSPGFVWRYQTDEGDATGLKIYNDPNWIFNMSVWESIEALRDYAFNSDHRIVLQRRKEWFVRSARPHSVLWWIPAGEIPTVATALEKLDSLGNDGPNVNAFTFSKVYPVAQLTP